MEIKTKKISKWLDPELIANHFALKFGDHGLSWLDSDGKDNGEWSFLGVNPKEIICSRNINNLDRCSFKIYYNDTIAPLSKENQDSLRKIIPDIIIEPVDKECYLISKSIQNKR